ncbi:MAG: YjgP/YjgQ family permease [Prolixibacteraceae bacterium]|jgi:lipopolysaccharide export system permease protein|nr:YjgP/YjgQ family permease [Prolixibacteraceae bacterium]MBT6763539.1 YjgP/YjgQ family permease [Prolixibacteraceae bacterium]MBT6999802.1 YjgP/YjgQ family permease [Prolixibacteraceae bacterium]MBT7393540.1 YjgP/YjgQ family permease [Prolixibacteraceae bacterium]
MKWYRTIDIYITKKFLGTFFYAIALIISISVVFDISENLDEFISKDIPGRDIVFDYYMNFIPYFTNLFSPLFTFIAVIYFTSKMAYNTEIIAILSSGVSYNRLMRPYLVSAFILAILSYSLGNFIIPPANKTLNGFRHKYIDNNRVITERNIHQQIEPGVYIYMQSINASNVGYRFTMERFEGVKLVEKLTAQNVRWDKEKEKWIINNYMKRKIYETHEEFETGLYMDTTLNMVPEDFKVVKNEMETFQTPALLREIDKMKMRGVNTIEWEIEKHRRIAGPFSAFILTIIGAGLASRKIKGGLGLHLGLGLLLSFSYILFMQVSTVFAISGTTPPVVAVWFPNLFYSIIALFVFRWAAR